MHTTKLGVRFGETDMAGHVNNAVYLVYLEDARLNFLSEVLHLSEFPLILASAKLDFLRQVRFPNTIPIETGISRPGRSSFDMVHRLYCEAEQELALTSHVTLVVFDYDTQKPTPIPENWRQILKAHWTDIPEVRS